MSLLFKLATRKPIILSQIVFETVFSKQYDGMNKIKSLFYQKVGAEIGGPSSFFNEQGYLPIYNLAASIDGCNFSNSTVWEGTIKEGNNYRYAPNKVGYQFICDGVDVPLLPKDHYDFVLSCNNLEHIANPLKALQNWTLLLKQNGTMVLVLPRSDANFDHRRPITTFDHLLEDYNYNRGEDDLTHLPEILKLHDLDFDHQAGSYEDFKKRCEENYANRCLHHHVYNLEILEQMCHFVQLKPIIVKKRACDYIFIAQKGTN